MFWDAMGKIADFVYFPFGKMFNSSVKSNGFDLYYINIQ